MTPMVSFYKWTVFVAAVVLSSTLVAEIVVMIYLLYSAVPNGDFGIAAQYQLTVYGYIK